MAGSLKWKITLNMWFLAALSALASGAITSWTLVQSYQESVEQQLQSTATNLISLGITDYADIQKFETIDDFIEEALHVEKVDKIIHVFTQKGVLLSSFPGTGSSVFVDNLKPTMKPAFSTLSIGRLKYRVLTTPYRAKSGKNYYLQISVPFPSVREIITASARWALVLFLLLSLLAFVTASVLAKKIIAPLQAVALYLNKLNPADTREWPPLLLNSPDTDLINIAGGVNALTLRVKRALYSMSRISRYLAHELRNPLTILKGEAETVLVRKDAAPAEYRDVLESSLEEIDRMNNVVSTVSRIFRREKTVYRPDPLNLSVWLDEQIPRWSKFLENPIEWNKPVEALLVVVDTDLLHRLLDNLVRNAKYHCPPGTKVALALTRESGRTAITFTDSGPGMPEDLIRALNSNDWQHQKVGIGLSLCLEIASVCHFGLSFARGEKGGLTVQIILTGERKVG